MRAAPLALAVLAAGAATACRRGALQDDAGGIGTIGIDAAPSGHGGAGMSDGGPPGAGDGPGRPDVPPPTADANCGMTGIGGVAPINPELLVVLDRSIAGDPTRWATFLSQVGQTITANDATIDWGLYAFPSDGAGCGMLPAAIDVAPGPGNGLHLLAHTIAAGTSASGTPAAAAIDFATGYMRARPGDHPKFLVLMTDGAPTCAGRSGAPLSLDPTQAQADAVAAIAAARDDGLPTIVLAPSATTAVASDVIALNALAQAGGYARSPGTGGATFFTEGTFPDLFVRVDSAVTCGFPLATAPPVPDVVTVTFNGDVVPRDPSHQDGWDYNDPSYRTIGLYGAWCDTLRTARSWQLEVYFGCPNPG
jgi:hypothetical protein